MSLSTRLHEYIAAAFSGIWVQSFEHADALTEIAGLCKQHRWTLATWDIDRGLRLPSAETNAAASPIASVGGASGVSGGDPLAAIKSINALATPEGSAILVMINLHRFLGSAEIVQALTHQITAGKQNRTFILVLSPVVQIPLELERLFAVVEHDMPDRDQLRQIASGIATEPGELPEDQSMETVLDAAAGLTRYEAENAFSLALVRHRRIEPDAVWELKTQAIKKSGLLILHRGEETFADLGGLEALKTFCLRAMSPRPRPRKVSKIQSAGLPGIPGVPGVPGESQSLTVFQHRPRGVMLLSPPGCGKSQFAKSLGHETGRPTLILDIGSLMGSLVGMTEERTRQALKIADAMAPCVLMVDEIEKALSGVGNSGQTDSGVSARLFGSLLTWLNDHESDVFFIATCNDISKLPPEFARAERFDGVFFVDLPTGVQRQAIWKIYLEKFGLDPSQTLPRDEQWTGAEIKACCRLAALLDLPLIEAAQNVVPVAMTAADSVERLRGWASGRCLGADKPGIYQRVIAAPTSPQPARRVARPGNN